jgi:hypothetical protein
VADRFHFLEHVRDPALFVDQEGSARNSHIFLTHHVLLHPDTIGFGCFVIHVREQRERQIPTLFEFGLFFGFIRRNADDYGVCGRELLLCVAKLARLERSAGCVGLWIEEQRDILAAETCEVEHFACIRLQLDGRGDRPFLRCCHTEQLNGAGLANRDARVHRIVR